MISEDIKNRITSVLNIFETGTADGKYDAISIYRDGKVENGEKTRQVTYGRSQTTEQGNLKKLIERYIANKGVFATDFQKYVPKIGNVPLADDTKFSDLLKKAAREDGIMRTTQDEFFDAEYYQPALKFFTDNGFQLPLSMLVIYDSYIHSGGIRDFLRNRFSEMPPAKGGDEKKWITAYVTVRQDWLLTKGEPLNKTIYRTKTLLKAIKENQWHLESKIISQGVQSKSSDDYHLVVDGEVFIVPVDVSKTLFMEE